jgi:phage/conjugal plasmid C-4 type zinc finger TraR family protein
MDEIDMAQRTETQIREEALLRCRARRHGQGRAALSATHCRECGDPIPEARRAAVPGVTLCLACQSEEDDTRGGGR